MWGHSGEQGNGTNDSSAVSVLGAHPSQTWHCILSRGVAFMTLAYADDVDELPQHPKLSIGRKKESKHG